MPAATLVLLHGQPDLGISLWPLRAALRARLGEELTVLTPDRPGYGANPRPPGDFEANAVWLEALVRLRPPAPVVLIGHSWGGGVAALTAARGRLPVSAVVLLASVGPHALLRSDYWLARPVLGEVAAMASLKMARRVVIRGVAARIIDGLTVTEQSFARPSRIAAAHRPTWRSFLHEQRALVRQLPLLESCLGDIAAPTLIVTGTRDSLIPAATPRALAAAIPNARVTVLPGAGHDVHVRRTPEVAESISTFLRPLLVQR